MNARSVEYLRGNTKKARTLADNKLLTKQRLVKNGIGVADLIAVIRQRAELREFDWESLPSSFVIKPNRGFGGEGIFIVFNRLKNGKWLTTGKRQLTADDLAAHVNNILDGNFSLLNTPDVALFESRLSIDPLFKRFASDGIPDIRVIVYNKVPVMAMLRVPTKKSGGKANLAQGGLGIGVDIATGLTTHVVQKGWFYEKEISMHPDTKVTLRGVQVPYWSQVLKTAVLAARVTGLRYSGVDLSVDKKRGPVILEVNARPGLGIQLANMSPLRERLRRIRGLKVDSPERGISIAKELFAGQLASEVATITGRTVIGLVEPATLYGKDQLKKKIRVKIDTGADSSSIDESLARELGFGEAIDYFASYNLPPELSVAEAKQKMKELAKQVVKDQPDIYGLSVIKSSHGVSLRIRVRMRVRLAGYTMDIWPTVVDRTRLTYSMLIGRRSLAHFLVDTTKTVFKKPVQAVDDTQNPSSLKA